MLWGWSNSIESNISILTDAPWLARKTGENDLSIAPMDSTNSNIQPTQTLPKIFETKLGPD